MTSSKTSPDQPVEDLNPKAVACRFEINSDPIGGIDEVQAREDAFFAAQTDPDVAVIDNLHRLVPSIAGPARLVPLAALANKEFSVAALRQAATRGRLEATLDGIGQWRSSQEALARYRQSRYKRATD